MANHATIIREKKDWATKHCPFLDRLCMTTDCASFRTLNKRAHLLEASHEVAMCMRMPPVEMPYGHDQTD